MAATAYLADRILLRSLVRRWTVGTLFAWMMLACCATAQERPSPPQLPPPPARSRCGRFYVSGGDNALKLVMLKWLERTTEQVTGLVGLDMPFDRRSLWVVLREESNSRTGRVSISSTIMNADLVQRITITNHELADARDARDALCRLLLEAYVLEHLRSDETRTGERRWRLPSQAPSIPRWLWQGLSLNLFSSERQRISGAVLDLWQKGRIPSLADTLAGPARTADASSAEATSEEREAACGTLVAWFADQQDRGRRFAAVFQRVAASQPLDTEWMAKIIPGCASPADLEQAWDTWLLKQRRIVYEPGTLSKSMMEQLDAALLLYPGFSGIRWSEGAPDTLTMRGMITMPPGEGRAAVALARADALRSLSLGRSDRLRGVTDAYCAFLHAVAENRPRKEIEELLDEAEALHATLREDVRSDNLRDEGERR